MTLSERYKFHSRKSIKPYFRLLLFVILGIITIVNTMARYNSHTYATSNFQVAKWEISVNNQKIDNTTDTLSSKIKLLNSLDNSQYLKPGDECYFDITINPATTEVSVFYTIAIDLTSGANKLPSGTKIEKYELYSSNSSTPDSTEQVNGTSKTISGSYNLVNNQALDSSSVRRYRIYCLIPDDAVILNGQEFQVYPVITFEQNI